MKLTIQITLAILIFCSLSCGNMRDLSIYEPSKSVSAFEQFPHKILFTNSEENGLWGIKNPLKWRIVEVRDPSGSPVTA